MPRAHPRSSATTSWPWPARARLRCRRSQETSASASRVCATGCRRRRRRRPPTRPELDGLARAARAEAPQPAPRAGERGAAPSRGLPVAGEPAGKMMYPLVRELAVDGDPRHGDVPGPQACSPAVLPLGRPQPVGRGRELVQAYLRRTPLFDAHRDDPEFGYRFLADEARDAGEPMCRPRTAWKICRDAAVAGSRRSARERGANGKRPEDRPSTTTCAPPSMTRCRLRHVFAAGAAERACGSTDITEHRTGEGKLYLCAIKDAYSQPDRRLLDQTPA